MMQRNRYLNEREALHAFLISIEVGNIEKAKIFIEQNPNIVNCNVRSFRDLNALICAARYPADNSENLSDDFIQLLIDKTINLNHRDSSGNGAIHLFTFHESLSHLNAFICADNADLNLQTVVSGDTACHIAAFHNKTRALKLLLDKEVNPNIPNKQGETPLHKACSQGNEACVRILLSKGAKVNAVDANNCTPLHSLSQSDKDTATLIKICQLLLDHGADIDCKSKHEKTPLDMVLYFLGSEVYDEFVKDLILPSSSLLHLCELFIAKTAIKDNINVKSLGLPSELVEDVERKISCMKL